MDRILEPELMDDFAQAKAYHDADFSSAHGERVALFQDRAPKAALKGKALDLGCGSGDIIFRFAKAFNQLQVAGVDGSRAMLDIGRSALAEHPALAGRVEFFEATLPSDAIPSDNYSIIMSHSFLHHLHKPAVLWQTIKHHASNNTFIFVADLRRPATIEMAQEIIDKEAANEPEILRKDYFNSLCAAFTPSEIEQQLREAGLDTLTIEEIGDNYLLIYGKLC